MPMPDPTDPGADWAFPRWIAHRGAGRLAPENTLAAMRVGASHGYRAFECDVKLSADGVPFLLHDATLERTTSGHGPASERPWSALALLDAGGWFGRQWQGEPPASLAALVSWIRRNGFALNVELKPSPGQAQRTGVAVAEACLSLYQAPSPPGLLFSSFTTDALAGAQQAAPGIRRALLLDKLWDGWLDAARQLGCAAVVTQHRLMDRGLRDQLSRAGLRALCYTVNEPADAQRLLALQIDGLITDEVDRFTPAQP